jgi:hypothetical protein
MKTKYRPPRILYDEDGVVRAVEQPPAIVPSTRDERQAAGKATVSQLLAQSFGKRLSSGATVGAVVPPHLRKYIKRGDEPA